MENKHSFHATLTANVFVSNEDFYFIFNVLKSHYDITVQMSVGHGGFIYGLQNRRTPLKGLDVTDDDRVCDFTSRQLGLIINSLEMQSSDQASLISLRFNQILNGLLRSQQAINKNISGWCTDLKQ